MTTTNHRNGQTLHTEEMPIYDSDGEEHDGKVTFSYHPSTYPEDCYADIERIEVDGEDLLAGINEWDSQQMETIREACIDAIREEFPSTYTEERYATA